MPKDQIIQSLLAAVECSRALDLPHTEGLTILRKHGFDNSNRYEFPATSFVAQKQEEALNLTYSHYKVLP